MDDKMITLELTARQVKALAAAAELGLRSGQLMAVLSETEDDMALVDALVKLKKSTTEEKARAVPLGREPDGVAG